MGHVCWHRCKLYKLCSELIPVKYQPIQTEVVPLKISSLKVNTEQRRDFYKLLTSQLEGEVVTRVNKQIKRHNTQTHNLRSNAKFQPCEPSILVTTLHLQLP